MSNSNTSTPTDQWTGYQPNKVAAIAVTIIFIIPATLHLVQMFRRGSAKYMWPFVVGCWFETLGFLARYLSAERPTEEGIFIGTTLLVILGPTWLAATECIRTGGKQATRY